MFIREPDPGPPEPNPFALGVVVGAILAVYGFIVFHALF